MTSNAALWLISLPLLMSPVIYLGGRLAVLMPARPLRASVGRWGALAVLLIMWAVFAAVALQTDTNTPAELKVGMITLSIDGLSLLMVALTLAIATGVVIYSGAIMSGREGEEKYYAMLMAVSGAMIGLSCTGDLFNLWLWFETMVVSSYLLVAFYRERPPSLEAAVKYLVQSAVGSALVLIGVALVLAQTGSVSLDTIRLWAQSSTLLLAAGGLFVVGFGVKAALVPMHTWLPDAYAQSPTGVSALMSGVITATGLIAMMRVLSALMVEALTWGLLLMGFGAVNMLVGNLIALRQREVKRLLAFSSISHIGFILLGLGVGLYTGQAQGAQAGLFHLLNHGIMKALAFLCVGALLYGLQHADNRPLLITDLAGASRRYPLLATLFALAVLSLAGMPPLAGFMSKWQILLAGFAAQNATARAFVAFAVLNILISFVYYLPLVNALYRSSAPIDHPVQPLPLSLIIPLVVLAGLLLVVGVWPDLLRWLTQPAALALIGG